VRRRTGHLTDVDDDSNKYANQAFGSECHVPLSPEGKCEGLNQTTDLAVSESTHTT